MKRLSLCLVLCLALIVLLAAPTMAQDSTRTIAGYGVGYGFTGDQSEHIFTFAFAGLKLADWRAGHVF